ncbi:MAG: glycosyltransferase family 4 protein [Phycisphaerae bacterium]|nr:glycosyltransferase family 4 protein [Phycisphaerae bacterium]
MVRSLAIIGAYPPPYGGIAVYHERLLAHLDEAGIDYMLYNTVGKSEVPGRVVSIAAHRHRWFARQLLFGRERVVFLSANQWAPWLGSWYSTHVRGKKIIIAFHGESVCRAWQSHGSVFRKMLLSGLRSAERLFAVNEYIRDFLEEVGGLGHKTLVTPAFIPPVCRDEDMAHVPEAVKSFCRNHDPAVLAVGAPILRAPAPGDAPIDLYGIDMTIEMVDRLRSSFPGVGVLWFMLDFVGSLPEYEQKMRAEVERRGLQGHWMFCTPLSTFYPIYSLVDLFVRPTSTDGDAVSIREAMHFGVPTIASDAVPRPEGVILFKRRDQESYERTVTHTLGNLSALRDRVRQLPSTTTVHQQIDVFRRTIAEAGA